MALPMVTSDKLDADKSARAIDNFLTFEDFPLRMTLDSMHGSCASVIHEIHGALVAKTDSDSL
jgi:hypothetical protein